MARPLVQRAVSEVLGTAMLVAHTLAALKPLAAFLNRAIAGLTQNERV